MSAVLRLCQPSSCSLHCCLLSLGSGAGPSTVSQHTVPIVLHLLLSSAGCRTSWWWLGAGSRTTGRSLCHASKDTNVPSIHSVSNPDPSPARVCVQVTFHSAPRTLHHWYTGFFNPALYVVLTILFCIFFGLTSPSLHHDWSFFSSRGPINFQPCACYASSTHHFVGHQPPSEQARPAK